MNESKSRRNEEEDGADSKCIYAMFPFGLGWMDE